MPCNASYISFWSALMLMLMQMQKQQDASSAEMLCCTQGMPWDWRAPSHRALDHKLKSALVQIHAAGVLHRDLHEGNILVTPDHRIMVLDFAAAQLDPRQELVDAEMADLGLTS